MISMSTWGPRSTPTRSGATSPSTWPCKQERAPPLAAPEHSLFPAEAWRTHRRPTPSRPVLAGAKAFFPEASLPPPRAPTSRRRPRNRLPCSERNARCAPCPVWIARLGRTQGKRIGKRAHAKPLRRHERTVRDSPRERQLELAHRSLAAKLSRPCLGRPSARAALPPLTPRALRAPSQTFRA